MYEPRFYRDEMENNKKESFVVNCQETDLWIGVDKEKYSDELKRSAYNQVRILREELEKYIIQEPEYLTTFNPYIVDKNAPDIVRIMAEASFRAGVGPMAAVAGAFSESVGQSIKKEFRLEEIIVENGGDIYVDSKDDVIFSVFSRNVCFANNVKMRINKKYLPIGICTSSGTVGHSFSFGNADAVTVMCKNTALADVYATALCNKVKEEKDIQKVIEESMQINDILGCIIILNDKIAIQGCVNLVT